MTKTNLESATEAQVIMETSKESTSESVLGEAEPWEVWETKLCLWSVGIGIGALVILGLLVNKFILP